MKRTRIKHKRDIHPGARLPREVAENISRGGSVPSKKTYKREDLKREITDAKDDPSWQDLVVEDLEWYFVDTEADDLL